MENTTSFTVKCLNPNCIGGRIEISIFGDSGYSNWTVMYEGAVEFKCHGCGKFASTDTYKTPNEPDNFEVSCTSCGSKAWDFHIQDVDESSENSHIECKKCKKRQFV